MRLIKQKRTREGMEDGLKILFTTSNYPVSKMIRSVTKEPVSHCALQYNKLIIHSTFGGVKCERLDSFLKESRILYQIEVSGTGGSVLEILANALGRPYDYGALIYLGIRFLLKKIRIPTPKVNLLNTSGAYLCTEFINKYVISEVSLEESSLITPYKLYLTLLENQGE